MTRGASSPDESQPVVAIVVPCFNEAARLNVDAFLALVRANRRTRLLFVNDGSTDATLAVLTGAAAACGGGIDVLNLTRNCGKAEAVRCGVLAALKLDPEFVGYWDADLSTPLSDIDNFAAVLAGAPALLLVTGARVQLLGRDIVRSPTRHYLGRVFATAASMVLRLPVYDTQCGAKLFRVTSRTAELFGEPFGSRWIFDVELLARLMDGDHGDPFTVVYEYPVARWHNVAGSKVGSKDFLRAGLDLYRIFRRYAPGIRRMRERGQRATVTDTSRAEHRERF